MASFKGVLKIIKRTLLVLFVVIIIILAGFTIYIFTSGPELPSETDKIISQVKKSELPEIVNGKTGFAKSGDINIWFESISPEKSSKGAVLLIMGIANDALAWPDYFIQPIVSSGYQVIRYDHRGTGMSDWIEDWNKNNPYSLEDMAKDGIAVLNCLKVKKAHIIGVSMGGMIAQQMTINHPERVLSLTSIMSSGYIEDPDLPGLSPKLIKEFIKLGIKYGIFKTEENIIKMHIASRKILMGNLKYNLDVRDISEKVLYNIRRRKGYNPKASPQHITATSISGSRYKDLKNIKVPTLIVHGKSDPFISIEHGEKCAKLITNAKTLWIDGMGHDIPKIFSDKLLKKIFENFNDVPDNKALEILYGDKE